MATTFAPADLNSKPIPAGQGEAVIYDGKVTGTPSSTTDILRFCRIPAGTRLADVNVRIATAFAAAWSGNWQLTACDGASVPIVGGSGTTATLQAVGAVTAALYPLNFEPVTTAVDCFLDLQLSALTTGAAGVATATAYGMANGAA
jgi:hypothetical protein